MHTSVEQLLKVQAIDNEKRLLQDAMDARPQELETDRRKLEQARAAVEAVAEKIKATRVNADKGEMEIRKCDADIEKHNVALNVAKTNEEYGVLKAQIEKVKEERSQLEESVLEKLTELDDLAAQKKELERRLGEEERSFGRKEADLAELLLSMEEKVASLSRERDQLASVVDPEHLSIYERVLGRYRDSAIAVVRDGVCQGCFMTVTAQHITLLMIGSELVQCMNCGRLLYLE